VVKPSMSLGGKIAGFVDKIVHVDSMGIRACLNIADGVFCIGIEILFLHTIKKGKKKSENRVTALCLCYKYFYLVPLVLDEIPSSRIS